MPPRSRSATEAEARAYLAKAEEYLSVAQEALTEGRFTATTGNAVHAGICAVDAFCAATLGRRSAGQDHAEALRLLKTAGKPGAQLATRLSRLLAHKNRAEYEPNPVPATVARDAVGRAQQLVELTRSSVIAPDTAP